jgi:TonB-linked SusC/RagA family outer membrane protein
MKKFLKLMLLCGFVIRSRTMLKIFKMARLTAFLILVGMVQVFASESYSQETKLTLRFTNIELEKVLGAIEDKSEFFFLYNKDLIDVEQKVNVNLENKKITEILDVLLEGKNIRYFLFDRQIVLSNQQGETGVSGHGSLVQQQRTVSGKVTDSGGQPLPGVTVVVKGTTQGTVTGADGEYTITNIPENATLVLSFVGMKTQEVAVGTQTNIDIKMEEETIGLDEVVAVGYGTQSKHTVTTAISKLDNKVLENIPYTNAANALKGTIPGMRVQTVSGQPGASPRIIIRGGSSIRNPDSATPLYVIDGVTRSNMNDINQADIESIQILKDAASTAIYGALGSNGVVIIQTKSGKAGKMLVNYKYDLTLSETSRRYDLLGAKDFVYYSRIGMHATGQILPAIMAQLEGSTYAGGAGNDLTRNSYSSLQYLSSENQHKLNEGWLSIPDPLDPSKTLIFEDNDYQDLLFRTGISHNHSFSITGGSERATFHLGIGYSDNEGIAIRTDYKRATLNFSGDIQVSDNVRAFARIMYSNRKDRQVHTNDVFKSGLIMPPTNKLYYEDGTLAIGRNFGYSNPMYTTSVYRPRNLANDLTLIIGGQVDILPGLVFEPQFSWNQITRYNRNFRTGYWNGFASFDTSRNASASFSQNFSPQFNGVFNYTKEFKDHDLNLMGGFSYFARNNDSFRGAGNGAATDLIPTLNASALPTSVSGEEVQHLLLGYFSRVTYSYKQKYLFNASLRYDGASNLGESNKWGVFPGVSLGWHVDKENFWTALPKDLLQLKVRGSYGVTGNISGLGWYQAQGEYSSNQKYDDNSALQISVLPNQELRWEQSKTLDFGFDIGLFNRRIDVVFDYYRRVTDNLLTPLDMPPSTGFSSIITNYGSLENKGYEIGINAHVMPPSSEFQWNLSFNVAKVNTKILKLPPNGIENNRVGGVYVWDAKLGDYAWKAGLQEGGRIGDLYGFKQVGIYATDEEAAAGPVDMLIPREDKTKHGGDVNWLDADENGIIDTRDKVYMGNLYPDLTGGFLSAIEYKNFGLNIRMDYTLGGTLYYETGARLEGNFSGANAISSKVLRSWENPGDVTDIPKYYWADQNANWNVWNNRGSSRYYQKTDFLSLREVTLSYQLPNKILNNIRLSDLRFHVTGSNLYYFTDYEGLNPEQSSSDTAYPVPREFIFGLSVNF